jgi:general secretion pathway protein I
LNHLCRSVRCDKERGEPAFQHFRSLISNSRLHFLSFKFQISSFKFQLSPGFTLLEVMIALAVISIALMALLGSQSQGLSLANESRFNTTASLLAQGKMAEIEAIRDQRDLASDSGDFGEEFPDYAWQLSVHDVSFEGAGKFSDRLKRIDLEVSYVPDSRYRYQLRLYRFFQ